MAPWLTVYGTQVVGEQEMKGQTVNVRTRDMQEHGMHPLADVTARLLEEHNSRSLTSAFTKHNTASGLAIGAASGIEPANQEPVEAAAVAAKAAQIDDHQFDKARVN